MQCKKSVLRTSIFLTIFCLFFTVLLIAQEESEVTNERESIAIVDSLYAIVPQTVALDSLFYESDSLTYYVDQQKILLTGNAKINYDTAVIKADSISINFQRDQATAMGKIVMEDGDQLILGQQAYYDIQSQAGLVVDGASRFELGYYYGSELRKVGDDVFDVDDGKFTTCDALHPHFDFRAHSMRVYRDHMVIAKPIFMYVNDFPILAFPFAAISIKRGRQSGILIPSPGFNQSDGKYLRDLAFFWVFNDYADVTLSVDLLEKTGQNYNIYLPYLDRYKYHGRLDARYQNITVNPEDRTNEWWLAYRHFHRLPEKATFDVNLDFASSRQVYRSETSVDKRLKEQIRSTISYRKPFTASSFNTSATYTENLSDNIKNITLPSFSYSLPSKPIHEWITAIPDSVRRQDHWWKNFSFSWNTSGTHIGYITKKSPTLAEVLYQNNGDESEHYAGIRQNAGINWNTTWWGWLKLGNSFTYQDAIFDRDRANNKLVHRYAYNTNSSLSFNLYGTRRFRNFPITAVRHIVTPSTSFRYSPDFSKLNDPDKLYTRAVSVPSGKKQRFISLGLEQKWQFKIRSTGQEQDRSINDLFLLRSSTGYDLEKEKKQWSDINHTLSFNPGNYAVFGANIGLNQSYSTTQDPYEFDFKSYRISSNFTLSGDAQYYEYFPLPKNNFVTGNYFPPDSLTILDQQIRTIEEMERLQTPGNWSLNTSHDYNYNRQTKYRTENLRNSLSVKLTTNWSISYNNYYDLKENRLMSQQVTVNRDLHCWKITFTYTKSASFWDYRVVFFNIKLPDSLKLENRDYDRGTRR